MAEAGGRRRWFFRLSTWGYAQDEARSRLTQELHGSRESHRVFLFTQTVHALVRGDVLVPPFRVRQ